MIRRCRPEDFEDVYSVINDGARAYEGFIPADVWHEPYMTREELRAEIEAGVRFWAAEVDAAIAAVMGIQDGQDVTWFATPMSGARTSAGASARRFCPTSVR